MSCVDLPRRCRSRARPICVDLGAIELDDTWDYRGKAVMMIGLDVVVGPVAG